MVKKQSTVGCLGIGICPCHITPQSYTTIFVTGSESVETNQKVSAIVGTVGISSCGHPTIALTGSKSVSKEIKESHRVGDIGANCGTYVVVTGSEDVLVGD